MLKPCLKVFTFTSRIDYQCQPKNNSFVKGNNLGSELVEWERKWFLRIAWDSEIVLHVRVLSVNIHCGVIWLNFPRCLDRKQLFVSELWWNNREKEKVATFVSNERKCKFRSRMYAAKPVLCWIVILCCWQETLGIVDLNLCHNSVFYFIYIIVLLDFSPTPS